MRVAVLCSGRGSNLQHLLRACASGLVAARVTLVVSDQPDAGALGIARRGNVPAVVALPKEPGETSAAYDARLLDVLTAEAPELVVLAGYLRIVGPAITRAFPGRIVNVHPALLPAFRGLRAIQQAVTLGVRIAGCTTHLVTDELDGGPILLQAAVAVRDGETEEHLTRRVLALEHLLLPRTVDLFAQRRVRVELGRAVVAPGDSWLTKPGVELAAGALYGEGF